jgi:hypothetical protein
MKLYIAHNNTEHVNIEKFSGKMWKNVLRVVKNMGKHKNYTRILLKDYNRLSTLL